MLNRKIVRVPNKVYDERVRLAKEMNISIPKAFCLFDNMMAEYVKSNRVKGRKTKIELILEEK